MSSVERIERQYADGRARVAYVARWRDPDGRQRKKSFAKKTDAQRHADLMAADVARGDYVDPDAGRETFGQYATRWLAGQVCGPSTLERVERQLRVHVVPTFAAMPLRAIRPCTVQTWVKGLSGQMAPTTARQLLVLLSTILAAAVEDELIRKNPCRAKAVRAPRVTPRKVVPWEPARVLAVRDALPERYKIVATLAAGLGLRQGEVFGLAVDDVDFLRGTVRVQRQVRTVRGKLTFAAPKGCKTRTVPLPASVRDALAAHLAQFPAEECELEWDEPGSGTVGAARLVITSRQGRPFTRTYFNSCVWKPALESAGVPATRDNGCHACRHHYASVLLDAGESIRAVSEYLGHSDPGFTLRTYAHVMRASEERTRRAIDAALGGSCAPDVPRVVAENAK